MDLAIRGGPPVTDKHFPSWPVSGEEERSGLLRVLESGEWGSTGGMEVSQFERSFAEYHRAEFGIATSSGTAALSIALRAAGIGPGDEVILPAYTFVASATPILDVLAKPVFVDIEPDTLNIDPAGVKEALTTRSKAILPVHFAGRPASMNPLRNIARDNGLIIIEEACQAWGAEYRKTSAGTLGSAGCFSFQSSKNISSGEGGMILTNNLGIARLSRSISDCGRTAVGPWYEHGNYGGNYRLTEFQGALLRAQLDRYPFLHKKRENAACFLSSEIRGIKGYLNLAPLDENSRSSWHLFCLRLDTDAWGEIAKEEVVNAIRAEGIPISPGYKLPVYKQPIFMEGNFGSHGGPPSFYENNLPDFNQFSLPNTERACSHEALWLTQNLLLADTRMLEIVIEALSKVFQFRDRIPRM